MLAVRRQISGIHPAKSRWSMAFVKRVSVCSRLRVKNLNADHRDYVQSVAESCGDIPKVKKVFIRSGIRFDYLLADKKQEFLRELCKYHVSGQLKVAPEHVAGPVLSLDGKTGAQSL